MRQIREHLVEVGLADDHVGPEVARKPAHGAARRPQFGGEARRTSSQAQCQDRKKRSRRHGGSPPLRAIIGPRGPTSQDPATSGFASISSLYSRIRRFFRAETDESAVTFRMTCRRSASWLYRLSGIVMHFPRGLKNVTASRFADHAGDENEGKTAVR